MQQVTFDEWCDFSLTNGPVTFSEPDADTMEGWRTVGLNRVLVVRATGYTTGKKQYFINTLATKEHRT